MNVAWLTAFTALAAAGGGLLLWSGRLGWRLVTRTLNFLDDWAGEPPRPGVEARPGVMARLQDLEAGLARVLAETRPDHGHSLRDVVHRAAGDVADVKTDVGELRRRVELFEREREQREGKNNHA